MGVGVCSDVLKLETGCSYWTQYLIKILFIFNLVQTNETKENGSSKPYVNKNKGSENVRHFSTYRVVRSNILTDILSESELYYWFTQLYVEDKYYYRH
jgi:hypothetical protein